MLTVKEMHNKIKAIHTQLKEGEGYEEYWEYIGLRFEKKEREIGEKCECSRHNLDREDEREFPDYNSEEYHNLPEREGTCAWDLSTAEYWLKPEKWWDTNDLATKYYDEHCYIIVGDRTEYAGDVDADEIIIIDAQVIAKIY